MWTQIFAFEFKRWIKSWPFYIYTALFFGLSLFGMASAIGVFDSVTVTTSSATISNSAYALNQFILGLSQLLYFLFPAIIGSSIYRDYKHNVHHILYAYPFTKTDYLIGKFFSAFSISLLICFAIGLGLYIGSVLPWGNPELLGANHWWSYVQIYLYSIIPNLLFMGVIVFAITTLSRSLYAGFATVLAVLIIQGLVSGLTADMDNRILGALLDPTGGEALDYYTQYWTVHDFNTQNLPLEKWVVINRLIWLGVSIIFMGLTHKLFKFHQQGLQWHWPWKRAVTSHRQTTVPIGIKRFKLPKVNYDFSFKAHWNNVFNFTKLDCFYLIKNKVFMILVGLGILMIISVSSVITMLYGTAVYPETRIMLQIPGGTFTIIVIVLTFLGAGLLVHHSKIANMNLLIHSTPVPNWVLFISKYFALIIMQALLLLVVIACGVSIQIYHGYYHFELGLYLQTLYGLSWLSFIIWAGLALAVQTLFKNYIIGFVLLFAFYIFRGMLSKLGIEQDIFFFNRLPTPGYSDMNGFGFGLKIYYVYVLYWLLFIGFISGLTLLFWRRGLFKFKERFKLARQRAKTVVVLPSLLCLIGFLGLGGYIYYDNTIANDYYSHKEREQMRVNYEKQYKHYADLNLPRLTSVKIKLDLYPKTRDFKAKGTFVLTNKSTAPVDTLLINYNSSYKTNFQIASAHFIKRDSLNNLAFYEFNEPLQPGDSAVMQFDMQNYPNTLLQSNSPVLHNGTFINSRLFPGLGYQSEFEISNNEVRKKYGLPEQPRMPSPSDTAALQNTYISNDADWINFETTVSTAADQIAIAPGKLQKSWTENNRRYFHYKMNQKMLNFYAYNSARYQVKRDHYKDIAIAIYYHKSHDYNLDRMISGIKHALTYYEKAYSPYQFKQLRIIEFPNTQGSFAQSFANTIPFSEAIGFIADVDTTDQEAVDYPFYVTAHEVAHQWWAHQVIGAEVQGATVLSESLAEYSALKVLEHKYGKGQMRKFLKESLDSYLSGRKRESQKEQALMYNENQQYIHYNKGSLVFYALSDYLGESKLNAVLSQFIAKHAFKSAPYPTAEQLVADIKAVTPDSLQYLIKDMFKTITLYDNKITKTSAKPLDNGQYQVDITALVSKYRTDGKGKHLYSNGAKDSLRLVNKDQDTIYSLPLNDYIEVGIFGKPKEGESTNSVLYLKKVRIDSIQNHFSIKVDKKPIEVGIDPYNKLIDTRSYDNRKTID